MIVILILVKVKSLPLAIHVNIKTNDLTFVFSIKASSDTQVFYSSLEALVQLSLVVGSALNPHLKALLPQVHNYCNILFLFYPKPTTHSS